MSAENSSNDLEEVSLTGSFYYKCCGHCSVERFRYVLMPGHLVIAKIKSPRGHFYPFSPPLFARRQRVCGPLLRLTKE